MTTDHARADRVRAVAEALHGKVLDRAGSVMTVSIPADVAPAFVGMLGEGGYRPIFRSADTGIAPRRVTNMRGDIIVCPCDNVTTSFYRYTVDIALILTNSS